MSTVPALRVTISLSALAENARRAVGVAGLEVADLRRDAFGHGVAAVAAALAAAGARAARVDDAGRDIVAAAGMTAVDADPTLDSARLYGFPGSGAVPAMRLAGTVLSTKRLLEGEGVSYDYTHRAARDTRVALVAGGYGQGIVRAIGNRVSVEVGGRLCPIVGRVAMDACVVDVGEAPAAAGDEVVYFGGDDLARDALSEWERATGLTAAELACAIGLHARRRDAA